MNQTNDGPTIHAVLRGDTQRFEEIVRRYERPLLRVAISRLSDRTSAEDAVQETMISAYKSLATYDSRYSFRTWLWTILLNHCKRNHRRTLTPDGQQRRTVNELENAAHQHVTDDDPIQHAIDNEQSRRLEHLLSTLPYKQADALRLRFFGGLKFQEIADVMNYSLSSAKSHVRQGLSAMTDALNAENAEEQRK